MLKFLNHFIFITYLIKSIMSIIIVILTHHYRFNTTRLVINLHEESLIILDKKWFFMNFLKNV